MKPHHHTSRLNTREQATAQQHSAQTTGAVEFATPEEMLRHDAADTPVPESVIVRLGQSLKNEAPPPRAPWWRRLFGG